MITTKKDICEAAIQLFLQDGIEQVSINKICSVLNVTRGSFYHHFESKNDLLLYWFSKHIVEMINYDISIVSPKQMLKQYVLEYARVVTALGEDLMFHIFMAELEVKGAHFVLYRLDEAQYIELIEAAKNNGEIQAKEPAPELIDMFSSAFIGAVILWRFSAGTLDLTKSVEQLFEKIYT